MSESDIDKKEQPSPEDVLAAITSFNDVTIVTNIFKELGWNYSLEIKETLALAKQNANLSIKFKAIKYLRELLKEAAEASGYTARVSQTVPNAQGGTTTFSARRISNSLNPVKQIKSTIKESENDRKEETQCNRGGDRQQSQAKTGIPRGADSSTPGTSTDTRRAFPLGDAESGGTEPPDGGKTPGRAIPGSENSDCGSPNPLHSTEESSPCIKTRPPTCDQDLFPGISSAED